MKTTSISEFGDRLIALPERVRHGPSIPIVDRCRPVAPLAPVRGAADVVALRGTASHGDDGILDERLRAAARRQDLVVLSA